MLTNRKLGLVSLPALVVLYFLFGNGFGNVEHWFGFLFHKTGEKIDQIVPVSVDVERLRFESGRTEKMDAEIVGEIAATTVKRRQTDRELAVHRDRLASTMKEYDFLEEKLAKGDSGDSEKYRSHRQTLLDRVNSLNGVITAKAAVIGQYDATLERLNQGRESVRRKREDYETLIANSESLQLLKKTSPASAFNPHSAFAVGDSIAENIRNELEKDRMELEIRNEAQSLFGRPVESRDMESVIDQARRLLRN